MVYSEEAEVLDPVLWLHYLGGVSDNTPILLFLEGKIGVRMFERSALSYWSVVRPKFLVCLFIKAFSSLKGMVGAVHKKQSFDRLKHN